jgi:hypothetical protein
MSWANAEEYEDIAVDLGGLEGQQFGDIANRSERYKYTCTWEAPGKFAGDGEKLRQDGLKRERWVNALVAANAEFSIEDVSAGGVDQVRAALELAPLARRAIFVIPLFAGAGYETLIQSLGGSIVFKAPAGTWSFVPDKFWKQGSVGKHVGYIEHPVAVVVFRRHACHSEGGDWGWDERVFVDAVESWWAARAPGGAATAVRARRRVVSDELQGWPAWLRWWDTDRQSETGWGWGRDARGGNGAWGRCGEWDAEKGGLGYAPPGFRTVLKGLGASAEAATAALEEMENLLRKSTKTLWVMRNKEQLKEEGIRDITSAQKRDTAAAKEWRENNPKENAVDDDEDAEEGEPGEVTRDGGGKALTKACRGCARIHGGTCRKCKRCYAKLPSGAREPQRPGRTEHVARTEDDYWSRISRIGKEDAEKESEKAEWKRTDTLWKKVVKRARSKGRGSDTDAPAGGPRGPNSDPTDEINDNDNYDNDISNFEDADAGDYNTEETEEDTTGGGGQGRVKRMKMTTFGGRLVGRKRGRREETGDETP